MSLAPLLVSALLTRQNPQWNPGPGLKQIPIWPKSAPGAQNTKVPEGIVEVSKKLIAGKSWNAVTNVSKPTITVYRPQNKTSDAAVIVFPGGGYGVLAIDLEGTEICDWLTAHGITAILLKYRVPTPLTGQYRESLQALQDAQRAISLVRSKANDLGISPTKVGVIGFSAGGHLVAATSTKFRTRSYPPQDTVDKISCRPDFAMAIYPGHISQGQSRFDADSKQFVLPYNPTLKVPSDAPPTFLIHAQDDPIDDPENSLSFYLALKRAKVPAELHLFEKGGHAFGLRKAPHPISHWPELLHKWLKGRKLI